MALRVLKLSGLACAAALAATPAVADVKAGVDAWSRGDYSAAVREWQGPADAGDADAMFNLAQAYRLGRGVAVNAQRAEALYARAAAAGHLQAADTYGLMLFQDGRRETALPFIQDAARRGDPRSQYLLGIAHFNGDLVPRDWVRAYALVTLANSAALPQAGAALVQMDQHIPLEQRQQAAGLAQQLRAESDAARSAQLAAADLAARAAGDTPSPLPTAVAARTPAATAAASRVPQPIQTVAVSPSIAAARAAVAEASRVTGTESPADAGASYARAPATPRAQGAVTPAAVAGPPALSPGNERPAPSPAPAAAAPRAVPPPTATANAAPRRRPSVLPPVVPASGPWRVQLGAFSVAGNAQRLWDRLSGRVELSGKQRLMVPAGAVTKLQAGGFATRDAAEAACRSLERAGHDCLVTR